MEQELITIPQQSALQVFTEDKALEPYLARIRQEIDAFVPEVGTAKGRKDIASIAFRVAKAKSYLDGVGKTLADEVKSIPKKIDANRKHIRDTLDEWRDEVRKPLTEWEQAEERRINGHTDAIARIQALAAATDEAGQQRNAATLRENLAHIDALEIGPACEEFETEYARAKDAARAALKTSLEARERHEADQAELERHRIEAAERAAREREDAIRQEAAERAKREAEESAQRERDAAERRELELRLAAEAAERRALEAEQRAKQEAEAERIKEAAEAARREANTRHRGTINRAAVAALVAGGVPEDAAKAAITLIAQRAIPAVTINY